MAKRQIAIVSGGMPHGPDTLENRSLGGSETAAIMVAKELAASPDNAVTLFAPIDPDYTPTGAAHDDGVRYIPIDAFPGHAQSFPFDAIIVSRNPKFIQAADDGNGNIITHQATKCFLWLHDVATPEFAENLNPVLWAFDGIWTVSEFHAQQVHRVTGVPLSSITPMRNGIVPYTGGALPNKRSDRKLFYASRPERGLAYLVAPGGVMDLLPEYELEFAMYGWPDQVPQHMSEYYSQLLKMAEARPNVKFLGALTQNQIREKLAEAAAYVYPSNFEETSCILAREAVSVGCPFIGTNLGALPESATGILVEPPQQLGDAPFVSAFAARVRNFLNSQSAQDAMANEMAKRRKRGDLDWAGVAEMMQGAMFAGGRKRSAYSLAQGLWARGDVVTALKLLEDQPDDTIAGRLKNKLLDLYPGIGRGLTKEDALGELAAHYDRLYESRKLTYGSLKGNPRFETVVQEIEALGLADGARVVEIGCCEGNQLFNLAERFPRLKFVGVDHSSKLIERASEELKARNLDNVLLTTEFAGEGDLALLTEVLEHVADPAAMMRDVDLRFGAVITTTPVGPWEANRLFSSVDEFFQPEHLWHIGIPEMEDMVGHKPSFQYSFIPYSAAANGEVLGNLVCSFRPDRGASPVGEIDVTRKLTIGAPREQTVGAAIICMNDEEDILRMLKSVAAQGIRLISLAIGPSTDATIGLIQLFAKRHPWIEIQITEIDKIEAGKLGFDDARNVSVEAIKSEVDWILWIDCDEKLVGNIRPYMRENPYQSYSIHQHHFTVEPRGGQTQIDRPARLFRADEGFEFAGKVHEHAEVGGVNGGPGHSLLLPNVDIAHTGYTNEAVRRRRFSRNFPLLEWDRKVNPDRDLGKFLWFRDIIHRMRYALQGGDNAEGVRLAKEAVAFYDTYWQDMTKFGNGLVQGMQYASEARKVLGGTTDVKMQLGLGDNRQMTISGAVSDPQQLTRVIEHALAPEVEKAKGKYR